MCALRGPRTRPRPTSLCATATGTCRRGDREQGPSCLCTSSHQQPVWKRVHAHLPVSPLTSITSSPLDRQISGICLPTGYFLQITLPMSGARFSHHSVESPQQQPNLSHSVFARLPTPKQKTPSETCAGLQYISSKTGISYNSVSITMDPTQYQKKKKKKVTAVLK